MTLSDWSNIASVGGFLLAFFVILRKEAGLDIYGTIWEFDPGTKESAYAEHLVERGKMFRRDMGSYGLWQPPEDRNDRW